MTPHETIGLELFGVACTTSLMAVRMWVQRGRRRHAMAAYTYEVCIWLAFACYLYITSIDIWSSFRQLKTLPPDADNLQLNKAMLDPKFQKMNFVGGICYTLFLWLVKGSFLSLYYELSVRFVRQVRITLYIVTGFVVITFIANILLKMLWCLPFKRNWSVGPDKCTFAIALPVNSTTTFFNIATDLALLTLFVIIIRSLKLHNAEVLASIFVGFIGSCTVIAAAVRYAVAYTAFITQASQASWKNTKKMLLWTNIEMGLVLLAVTLPSFRVFLRRRTGREGYAGYSNTVRSGEHFPSKAVHGHITMVDTELRPVRSVRRHQDDSSLESVREEESVTHLCPPGNKEILVTSSIEQEVVTISPELKGHTIERPSSP